MTHDDLLEAFKAGWRDQPVRLDGARREVLRRERAWRRRMWLHALGVCAAAAGAAWMIERAWATGEAMAVLGAAGLLVALPLILIEHWWLRRRTRPDPLESPEAVLQQARRQTERSLLLLRGAHWSAIILLGCAAAAWALFGVGAVAPADAFLVSAVWAGTALSLLGWRQWRKRRIRSEIAQLDRLAAEFSEYGDDT